MMQGFRSLIIGTVLLVATGSNAQVYPKEMPDRRVLQTFHLVSISGTEQLTGLAIGLRNLMDPNVYIYPSTENNSLTVRANPEQMEQVKELLVTLDRPKKVYRLTYTVNESDSGKRIGSQHFTMVVVPGQRAQLKQGNKVPIVTGSYDEGKNGSQTQLTYLDVGMNFDVKVLEMNGAVTLETKVEQSSIAPEPSGVPQGDPIVRQTVLTQTSALTLGKPQVLGAIDVLGSTRHLDFEVVADVQQ